jgi:hypothetical protein
VALVGAPLSQKVLCFATIGAEPLASTPEEYAADIDREETKWSTLIKSLGLNGTRMRVSRRMVGGAY